MTVQSILIYDNPLLRKKSKSVTAITPEIRKLIKDMTETMYANKGAGLAAVQIGKLLRVIVIDTSEEKNSLIAVINPKIFKKFGERVGTEACLSVPYFEGEVTRYKKVIVKGKDSHFNDIQLEAEDYLAVAFQHEIDHLDGIIYTDKVAPGKLKSTHESADL